MLVEVKMRMDMDRSNTIGSFEELGMMDPFRPEKSIREAIDLVYTFDFFSEAYPPQIMEPVNQHNEEQKFKSNLIKLPNTVFLPSKALWRKIIRAVVKFGEKDDEDTFLLRFALVEKSTEFIK